MKKITLLFFMLCSLAGYSQLALEGFEGTTFPPTDWSRHNIAGPAQQWVQGDVATGQPAHEGTKTAYINREQMPDGTFSEDYLVTKPFIVPANPQVRFWSRLTINGNNGNTYKVMLLPAGGNPNTPADYVLLKDWTEPQINPSNEEWNQVFVSNATFAGYTGQTVRIAFVMLGDFGDRWLLDEVEVVTECLTPDNLTANNITQTSAMLSWDNPSGATTWEIEILDNAAAPTGNGIDITTMPYTVSGLDFDTCYKYYVKAKCSTTNESEWEGPYTFCTVAPGATCNAPWVITALPFSVSDNTGNFGDDFDGSPGSTGCGTTNGYLDGDDVVYAYTAAANGVISIDANGLGDWAGMFVYDDCADIGVSCIAGDTGNLANPMSIPSLSVTAGTTYYIVISTWAAPQSTPYNLIIQQVNCAPPVGLPATNIGQTSADLSWTNPSGATSWEIVIQAPGGGIPPGAGTTVTTNTNYPATGLTQATPYEYWVRAACGGGLFSAWAGPYLFNTTICDAADQCSYSFIMTDSWGDGWNGNTMTVSQNGITIATIGSTFTTGQGPVTVTVPICDDLPLQLFWNTGGGFANEVGVSIQNNFGQTFYTKAPGTGTQNSVLYSGTIDCDTPLCLPPGGLTATNITTTTAELNWSGPNTGNWDYYVVPAGDPAPTAATPGINTIAKPVQLTNLTAGTNYQYYVRLICDATTSSAWAGPFSFNTAVCEPSAQCNFIFELIDSWGDGWNGNTMTIYQAGVPVATIGSTFTTGQGPVTVEVPLCPGVPFEVFWNNGGSFANEVGITMYSPFLEDIFTKAPGTGSQGTVIFTNDGTLASCTPPPCPKPQNLVVTNLLTTSAELGWTEMGTATSWEVELVPFGDAPTGVGTVTSDNPILWDELESGTTYQFYVRALCGGTDGNSNWSGPYSFTTAIENDDCAAAETVLVNEGTVCDEFVTGTITGATSSGITPSCAFGTIEYDVWFEFVAENPTHSIAISDQVGATFNYAVYQNDCDGLTELACYNGFDGTGSVTGLVPGTTYKIMVYTTFLNDPTDLTSFELCIKTPASINVTNTQTVTELVSDVLITSDCASISNITWSTGNTNGLTSENGIGFFEQGTSSFPIEQGIVLSTGSAMSAIGPNTINNLSEGDFSWPGDAQLFDYITDLNIDPGLISYNNATVLEFDFVPLTNHISFPFVFASDEYGTYQCAFSDAFAFFLTNEAGETVNLALLPDGITPISVVTIRDDMFNSGCASANEDYFGEYYGGPGLPNELSPTGFNGHTVPLVAQSAVNIGETYHIKLVIADRNDSGMDSAVFIGPFDIGDIDLGPDLTVADNTAACQGDEVIIESGLDPADYSFVWLQNGEIIPNETGPNLVVTEEGEYTIQAQYLASTCSGSDSIIVEFYDSIEEITGDPVDLYICDASGFGSFNLEENTPNILDGAPGGLTITYHASEENAEGNIEALVSPYTNIVQYQQPIYVRIVTATGCVGYKTFNISVGDNTPDFEIPATLEICEGKTGTITVVPGNFDPMNADVTFTWTHDGAPMAGTGPGISVTDAGVYEVVVNNTGCTASATTTVTIIPAPDATISYAGTPYCSNGTTATVTHTGTIGGVYSSTDGLVIDPATGEIDLAASEPGTYIVTYTIAATETCDPFFDETEVVITPLPEADFAYDGATFCVNFGSTAAPSFATNAIAGTFIVTPATGLDINSATGIFNAATSTPGEYTIINRIAAAGGCDEVDSEPVVVTIIPAPIPDFSYSQMAYCQEETTDASPIFTTGEAGTFSATPSGLVINASTGVIDLSESEPGTYQVTNTIAATADCDEVPYTVDVVINATPVFVFSEGCDGNTYKLEIVDIEESFVIDNATYAWTGPDGFTAATAEIEPVLTGDYTVTVTTPDGCTNTMPFTVETTSCLIQKGISPGDDDKNNTFDLTALDVTSLSIFNRYGQEVFSYGAYTNQWGGQDKNGNELPTGTYFYSFERANGETKTGWIYVNRQN